LHLEYKVGDFLIQDELVHLRCYSTKTASAELRILS